MAIATVQGFAKINLVLDVLSKRADGYHDVAMIMQSIQLSDTVILEESNRNRLNTENAYIPKNMNNLALRAVALMQQNFSQIPPISVTLQKRIPVAAGLAGGSADCAAVLLGLNSMYQLGLSLSELELLAAQLGSDIPFCVRGGTCLATGKGDQLEQLPSCPKLYFVLVKLPFGVSTPKVYGNLEPKDYQTHPNIQECIRGLVEQNTNTILNAMGNVLEKSTFRLRKEVLDLKEDLQSRGAKNVLMSGSGPTIFAAFERMEEAKNFYESIKSCYSQVFYTETVDEKQLEERVYINE